MKIAKPSSYSSFAPSNDGNTCAVKSWCAGALALLAGLVLFNVHWWNDVRREISQDENMESRQQRDPKMTSSSKGLPPNLAQGLSSNPFYPPKTPSRSSMPQGQQLLLDLVDCPRWVLSSTDTLQHVVYDMATELTLPVAHVQVTELEPSGTTVVASLGDSHLTLHAWPNEGTVLVDLFLADEDNVENLRATVLPKLARKLGGDLDVSTYSLIPRGPDVVVDDNPAFSPESIMTRHQYKKLVSEVQSPFQNVAIYDHHSTYTYDTEKSTTRSLFLDGVVQSNIEDEFRYHETLVQPAMIAAGQYPKRVLIVGGGEGGTLRETLKWKSVEEAVMVDLDAEVVRSSRRHLSTYNNCTFWGSESCFDDPRTSLYTEDFFGWFDKHIGKDICDKRDKHPEMLFDVIILDLLDPEELPEGQAWAEYLYSDLFFERIACSASDHGVVVSNFGEAPDAPYDVDQVYIYWPNPAERWLDLQPDDPDEKKVALGPDGEPPLVRVGEFEGKVGGWSYKMSRKMDQLRSFSSKFQDFRVYDSFIPSFRGGWAFAMGILPRVGSVEGKSWGDNSLNYFDGTTIQVDYKIHHGLIPTAWMEYYDGAVQQGYRQPMYDWEGAFCWHGNFTFYRTCGLEGRFFNDEERLWEVQTNSDKTTSIVAKIDLNVTNILGSWDNAFPGKVKIADSMETSCNPNTAPLLEAEPWLKDDKWNPYLSRTRSSRVASSIVLLRDVKAGEKLTRQRENC